MKPPGFNNTWKLASKDWKLYRSMAFVASWTDAQIRDAMHQWNPDYQCVNTLSAFWESITLPKNCTLAEWSKDSSDSIVTCLELVQQEMYIFFSWHLSHKHEDFRWMMVILRNTSFAAFFYFAKSRILSRQAMSP